MATSDSGPNDEGEATGPPSIQVNIASSWQNVRLLEVPEDLADLITSFRSVSTSASRHTTSVDKRTLKFKSTPKWDDFTPSPPTSSTSIGNRPASGRGATDRGKEGFLHLCSDEKVWTVKQVSTSNSLYVMRTEDSVVTDTTKTLPSSLRSDDRDYHVEAATEDDDAMDIDTDECGKASTVTVTSKPIRADENKHQETKTMTAFAKPTSILELHPLSTSSFEDIVLDHLPRLVPVYRYSDTLNILPHDEIDGLSAAQIQERAQLRSKATISDIFDNVPVPDSIIENILSRACVFQIPDQDEVVSRRKPQEGGEGNGDGVRKSEKLCYMPSPQILLAVWAKIIEGCTISGTQLDDLLNTNAESDSESNASSGSDLLSIVLSDTADDPAIFSIARKIFVTDGTGLLQTLGLVVPSADSSTKSNERGRKKYRFKEIQTVGWLENVISLAAVTTTTTQAASTTSPSTPLTGNDDSPAIDPRTVNGTETEIGTGDHGYIEREKLESSLDALIPTSWMQYYSTGTSDDAPRIVTSSARVDRATDPDKSMRVGVPVRPRDFTTPSTGTAPTTACSQPSLVGHPKLISPVVITATVAAAAAGRNSGNTPVPAGAATKDAGSSGSGKTTNTTGGGGGTTSSKRKWHEKFAAQRNIKR